MTSSKYFEYRNAPNVLDYERDMARARALLEEKLGPTSDESAGYHSEKFLREHVLGYAWAFQSPFSTIEDWVAAALRAHRLQIEKDRAERGEDADPPTEADRTYVLAHAACAYAFVDAVLAQRDPDTTPETLAGLNAVYESARARLASLAN
jgi:hypothetical protein